MKLATAALAAVLTIVAMPAQAALHLVGQWQVDQGPSWTTGPAAYTGQEAAALLFGGTAASYQISTVGPSVASIDHKAWYSVLGVGGGFAFAENYNQKYLGTTYGPSSGYSCCGADYTLTNPASAYVSDNALGGAYTNYAFSGAVPEPTTWALMIGGFGLVGATMRRRAKTGVTA